MLFRSHGFRPWDLIMDLNSIDKVCFDRFELWAFQTLPSISILGRLEEIRFYPALLNNSGFYEKVLGPIA